MNVTTATPILGPAAWRGGDLARTTDWIRPITYAELEELARWPWRHSGGGARCDWRKHTDEGRTNNDEQNHRNHSWQRYR